LVSTVLKRRAEQADGTAADLLRAFARLPIGTRDERFGFLTFLQNHHLIGPTEPVAFWDGNELREVTVTGTEIYREPKESDLPPDLDALLIEAVVLHNEDRPDEAEVRLKRILERVPDHPVARMNLAALRSVQGQTEESLRLLNAIVDKHPDYLFARCSLAQRLIEQRELEEAEQLLDGLVGRERLHIQEAFLLWGTLAMLYTAKGEEAAAQRLLDGLEAMVEDDDDARRLAGVKDAVARLDPTRRVERALKTLLRTGPKPAKRSG
jgi:tetratricopeptide (TPR) repeat protein